MAHLARSITTVALLGLLAAGCGEASSGEEAAGDQPDETGSDGLDVVSTMSVFDDFADAVGGDLVEARSLVQVGGDPHTYEPTPSDASSISEADVVLDNGLGLSPWFEPLADNVTGELVILTDGIAEQAVEEGGELDPHMWMVPEYVSDGYLTAIEDAFAAADPGNADAYAANADRYRDVLADLDADLAERFETIPPDSRKLVTSHDAYSYFADRYGLEVVGTVIGVTTEEEPSAASVSELVDQIRTEEVPAIFVETTVNPDLIERVAADAGVEVGEPLYGDSVGEEGSGAEDYLGMMRANVDSIVTALGGGGS